MKFSRNQKIVIPTVCLIIFFTLLLIFQNSIFYIKNIKVLGNDYIDPQYIQNICKKYKGNLLSINKNAIIKEISMNPYIKKVVVAKQLLGTLVVKLDVRNLIGAIDNGVKLLYIDEKGQILPENLTVLKIILPIFTVAFTEKNEKIPILAKELAVLKYNDRKFFEQITKIDLSKTQETDIFMVSHNKVYSFLELPSLKEFIKIKFLETKDIQGREIQIRGDSVIIKD